MMQMAVVLTFSGGCPIVKVGRVAGQFAKPRSADFEDINGLSLPSYRGDIINDIDLLKKVQEIKKPKKLLKAYNQSAATMNLLRAFSRGGMADLNQVHLWNLDFVKDNYLGAKYEELANKISESLKFMKACGITSENTPQLNQTTIYFTWSILLNYEQSLTRRDSITGRLV